MFLFDQYMFLYYRWVKRDSYLPVGSQGLKAVAKVNNCSGKIYILDSECVPFDRMQILLAPGHYSMLDST